MIRANMAAAPAQGWLARPWGRRAVVAAIFAGAALLYYLTARRTYFYDSDTSTYLELARSLVAGEGYVFDGERHTKFPPGVPLLLAPFAAWFDGDFALLYRIVVTTSLAALAAAAWWLARRGEQRGPWILGLCAASAGWHEFSTGASLSEAPFALALFLLLAVSERVFRGPRPNGPSALLLGLLGTALVLLRSAGLAVAVGILATFVHQHWRGLPALRGPVGRLCGLFAWLPGLLAAGAWMLWTAQPPERPHGGDLGHETSYLALWRLADPREPDRGMLGAEGLLPRLSENLGIEGRHAAEVLTNLPWIPGTGLSPVFALAMLVCFLGWRRELARENPLGAWVGLAYAGLISLWPYDEGRRFVMPLAPLLFVFAAGGLRDLAGRWRRSTPRSASRLAALGAAAGFLFHAGALFLRGQPASLQSRLDLALWGMLFAAAAAWAWRPLAPSRLLGRAPRLPQLARGSFAACFLLLGVGTILRVARTNLQLSGAPLRQLGAQQAAEWINEHAPSDACVLATDHAALRYATGRSVAILPVTGNRARLAAALIDERPDYVVINAPRPNEYFKPSETERLALLQEIAPGRLEEVARTERVSIWRVPRD
jgi:hypothetical protein